jgi:hypothetical protein
MLVAAAAAAVYRRFVFSQFAPSRLEISGAELHSAGHVVSVALPDLSHLRGQTAVLGVRLRNFRAEPRHIGLLVEGLPTTRIIVPPCGTTPWVVVLPPALMQTLADRGGAPGALEVTGDADGWAVIGIEIPNYHRRLGDRLAVVLLGHASPDTPATGLPAVAIALALAALASAFGTRGPRTYLQVTAWGLALTSLLVCVTCLALPLISRYQLLLSRPAFLLVVTALFSPLLFDAPALFIALASSIARWRVRVRRSDAPRGDVRTRRGAPGSPGSPSRSRSSSGVDSRFFGQEHNAATAVATVIVICLAVR